MCIEISLGKNIFMETLTDIFKEMPKCCDSHFKAIEIKAQSDEVTALRSLSKLCVLVPARTGFILAVDRRAHGQHTEVTLYQLTSLPGAGERDSSREKELLLGMKMWQRELSGIACYEGRGGWGTGGVVSM